MFRAAAPPAPKAAAPDSRAAAGQPPALTAKVGSLGVFWTLIEPIMTRLRPRRLCEIGVENGAFTTQLLAWARDNHCGYTGIDPVIDPALTARLRLADPAASNGADNDATEQLLAGRSLDLLPDLPRCGVYFVDGDHNHHTVRHELDLIAQAAATAAGAGGDPAGPVIFAHDVGWPWGRRDMYYDPDAIPADARHSFSGHLGVPLEGSHLIDGGLRAPGHYSIALHAGGPRNGVLTAVEDFLAGDTGKGWEMVMIPAAYGLAILYRPDDKSLPTGCRNYLRELGVAVERTGGFLSAGEANYLTLYFYGEATRYELEQATQRLHAEQGAHHRTLQAYAALEGVYHAAIAHGEAVGGEYRRLQGEYSALLIEYNRLLKHCADVQRGCDKLVSVVHAALPTGGGPPATTDDPDAAPEA